MDLVSLYISLDKKYQILKKCWPWSYAETIWILIATTAITALTTLPQFLSTIHLITSMACYIIVEFLFMFGCYALAVVPSIVTIKRYTCLLDNVPSVLEQKIQELCLDISYLKAIDISESIRFELLRLTSRVVELETLVKDFTRTMDPQNTNTGTVTDTVSGTVSDTVTDTKPTQDDNNSVIRCEILPNSNLSVKDLKNDIIEPEDGERKRIKTEK